MTDFVSDDIEIYKGLQKAFLRMKDSSTNAILKILEAQEHFFKTQFQQDSKYMDKSRDLLESALRKFEYSSIVVEQLHALREVRSFRVNPNLAGYYGIPPESENEAPFLDELLFDQSLFLLRSFLDFYMKYVVYFCTKRYIVNMSIGEFNKAFNNVEESSKPGQVKGYFQQEVFNMESQSKNWGNTLRNYRDKTTHNKLINLTMKEVEIRTGQTIVEPTTQGQEVSFFVQQTFDNNVFEMLRTLTPILYEVKWITGPYRPKMYLCNDQIFTSKS